MKRALLIIVLAIAALIAVLLVRTFTMTSRQITAAAVSPPQIDRDAAVARFARAIQFRTVSGQPHEEFVAWLAQTYPRVHASMRREVVGNGALLFTWAGSDPSLAPLLLMGHYDVVPVEPGTKWTHDPFSGAVADGFIWGRGTLDDKGTVIATLEAAELLLGQNHHPRRTILFAFGADEEVGGANGAAVVARLLASRGVKLDAVIDEGGVIAIDSVEGAPKPVALIGIAEKGMASVELRSRGSGGHSSMPPERTEVGRIAAAVDRVQQRPFDAGVKGAAEAMFRWLGPEMPFGKRMVFANLWLFEPVLEGMAKRSTSLNATLRTTTAPTIIGGGVKDNVIPSEARAVINFRILPGETVEQVVDHVRRAVDDEKVQVRLEDSAWDPSPVSDAEAPQFRALQRTIMQTFPDTIVAPYLVVGATDARYFRSLSANVYRFTPVAMRQRDLSRVHGIDERVEVEAYVRAIAFYVLLMRNMGG
ncbi:MAG TPA: M20 family peptidase [Thermoanaerobaculia bacterium]|nr:M20 family peptidase [Thermoanaerobaculia bacterium]